jgi:hypothetical protein
VRLHINDGRAFFHQARSAGQHFDVIVFGLVDSQTALSVMSSLRLEFFLYSRESFEEALSLLDPQHGLFVVGFSIGWKDWVAQRIYHTLELANHAEPLAIKASEYLGTVSFVAGPGLDQAAARLAQMPDVRSIGADLARVPARPVRDDWPFLYQNPRSFPFVYLGSLVLILIVGAYLVRSAVGRSGAAARNRLDWTMFFMGSAFLSSRPRTSPSSPCCSAPLGSPTPSSFPRFLLWPSPLTSLSNAGQCLACRCYLPHCGWRS